MHITRLALDHFRSWEQCVVDFEPGVNILQGANGLGKTNIVEAVEFIATGGSHRATGSLPLIERGETSAVIRVNVAADPDDGMYGVRAATPSETADGGAPRSVSAGDGADPAAEPEPDPDGAYAGLDGGDPAADTAAPAAGSEAPADASAIDAGATAVPAAADAAVSRAPAPATSDRPTAAAGPGDVTVTTYEATIAARGANRARVNGGPSRYMRDIAGAIPCIAFTPEDQRLVAGDPASRRTFLNQAGALLTPGYAERLQACTHIARQRSTLLKQLGARDHAAGATDAALGGLEIWTGQFIEAGVALTRMRADIVGRLAAPFARIYGELAGDDQTAGLEYDPSFDEVLAYERPEPEISRHFQRLYPGEVARGQNLIGPNRDDLTLTLNGMPAREFASNGEMWTLALALKMALYGLVAEDRGTQPIVILDDVFAQLDESRREQILDFARRQRQVLITVAATGDVPGLDGDGTAAHVIDVAGLKAAQDRYLHPELALAALMGGDGTARR